jgi:tRNA threonylcarbamoyladenosine biosynthesis protein TsaE
MVDTPDTDPSEPARRHPASPAGDRKPHTVFALSEDETMEFGRALARALEGGELILLEGELGLGKTVFVRGVAAGLGLPPEDVSSPSFTLIQQYSGGRLNVFHVDLYRLDSPEEVATLGLEEILDSDGVTLVEWGEKLPPYYSARAVIVRFHEVGEGCRRIELAWPQDGRASRLGDA